MSDEQEKQPEAAQETPKEKPQEKNALTRLFNDKTFQTILFAGLFFGGLYGLGQLNQWLDPEGVAANQNRNNTLFSQTADNVPLPDCGLIKRKEFLASNGRTYIVSCK